MGNSSFLTQNRSQLIKAKVVSDSTSDPLNLGRVQVYIPMLHGAESSDTSGYPWADCLLSNVGSNITEKPSIGSFVLVGFEGNDYDKPIVFGIYASDTAHLGDANSQQGIEGTFSGGTLAEIACQVIFGNEGSYTSVNWNDNGAISVGRIQWHGDRGRNLMVKIKELNSANYLSICTKHGANSTLSNPESGSWSHLTSWTSGCPCGVALKEILGTDESKKAQDTLMVSDISGYLEKLQAKGVSDPACLIYLADIYNQGPAYALKYATYCAEKKLNIDTLHSAVLAGEAGVYGWINDKKGQGRRIKTYNTIKQIESEGKLTPTALSGVVGDTGNGQLAWPIPGYSSITSPYGMRGPIKGTSHTTRSFHNGIDIGTNHEIGKTIIAAEAGKVIISGTNPGGYGEWVVIYHPKLDLRTLYGHGSHRLVSVGQEVQRGTKIMMSGNTGNSSGPHLHFTVAKGSSGPMGSSKTGAGCSVNPMPYLSKPT